MYDMIMLLIAFATGYGLRDLQLKRKYNPKPPKQERPVNYRSPWQW